MQILPNTNSPFVNKLTGLLLSPWIQYLQQFTQSPPNFVTLDVTASPFRYVAKEPGYLHVYQGTISTMGVTRGVLSLDFLGQILIPVSINDTVEVDYSVAPTIKFIPIYGAATK